MNALLPLLAQCAVLLGCGSTVLLALGCGAAMLCKSPVHRQRISELTITGVLIWMVLALFPLPRLLPEDWSAKPQAAEVTLHLALAPTPIHEVDSLPTVTEWVQEVRIAENESDVSVGWPSQAVLKVKKDGLGSPSYVANEPLTLPHEPSFDPSPSAEIAPLSPQIQPSANNSELVTTTPPAWQFDSQKLAGLFTGAYLAGASLCLFWIFAGYILLLRIRQTAQAPPTWLTNQYQALARQAGIAPPRLIVSRLCGRPLTWGMLWPVIVLPHSLCRQENKSQLRTILLHELGHITQQDAQGNFLFCLALPLLYAHPLYWWLRRESQLAAELVADDWAAWQTGKETYVEELVALARCTGTSSLPLVGVTGLFSSPSQFYRRMSMLLAREKPLSTKTSLPWRLASLSALAGSVALAASLAGVRPVSGQTEPPANTPAPALTPPAAVPVAGTPPVVAPLQDSPLNADEAALLSEIKQLQDKLRALEAKRQSGKQSPAIHGYTINPGAGKRTIVPKDELKFPERLRRQDENDSVWRRLGLALDPIDAGQLRRFNPQLRGGLIVIDVRPESPAEKLGLHEGDVMIGLGKWETLTLSSVAWVLDRPDLSDGQPIRILTLRDGESREGTIRAVDAATGKIIATTLAPANGAQDALPAQSKGAPTVTRYLLPPVAAPNTPAAVAGSRIFAAQSPAEPNMARGAQQLDLVSLATSYADAVSVLEAAEARMADIAKLADSKAISQQEVVSAKLAVSAAQRKEQLLRRIAQTATESAKEDFARTSQLHKSGGITTSAITEAKTRLIILEQILDTRPAGNTPAKP